MKHTKEQLEAMSKFDINCLVAIASGYGESWVNRHSDLVPDYCNNWSDMGPLIEECDIDLQHDHVGNGLRHASDKADWYCSAHVNIKRVAAIVYVLIKQGE